MESRLIDSLVSTPETADAFSDAAVIGAMLEFEVALAAAEAEYGIIPPAAADAIASAATVEHFDAADIARQARTQATPAIPFVRALTARVRGIDATSARFVHWGATSQDVVDTALVLCLSRATAGIEAKHRALAARLIDLSEAHASTMMLGRTLLQPATPITFGLKVALWVGGICRAWRSAAHALSEAQVLQCGGAAGTLAPLGEQGLDVQRAVARRLGLTCPSAPWHAERGRLAAVVNSLAVYVCALAKMAGDVSLLMQAEVGEVAEQGGGSSTMPHKLNPSSSAIVLAAADRAPGLAASMIGAMRQEHERAVGGWHMEAPVVRDIVVTTGSAVTAALELVSGLRVSPAAMRANIDATGGVIFAERLTFLLAAGIGRDEAARLVTEAIASARESGRSFGDEVRSSPVLSTMLPSAVLADLENPASYLGSAERFRQQVLADVRSSIPA
jgi:3-carboxy-cis,cis-muconate cycloisomerase